MQVYYEYKLLLTGITQYKLEEYSNNQKFNNINKPPTHDDNNSNNVQTDDSHTDPANSGSVQTPYSYTKVRPTEKTSTSSPNSGNLPKTDQPTEVCNDQPKGDCFKTEPLHTAAKPTEYSQINSESLKVGNPHNTDELTDKPQIDSESLKVGTPNNTDDLTEKRQIDSESLKVGNPHKKDELTQKYQIDSESLKVGNPHNTVELTQKHPIDSESLKVGNPHNTDELTENHQIDSESLKVGNPHDTGELTEKHQTTGTLQQIHLQEPEDPTDTQTQKSSSSLDNLPSTDISTGSRLPNNGVKTQIILHFLIFVVYLI